MDNPSLRREPRYEPAPVIPLKNESGLLDWLRQTGRLKNREPNKDFDELELLEQDEEIAELIDIDDYGDDDDFDTDTEDLEDLED